MSLYDLVPKEQKIPENEAGYSGGTPPTRSGNWDEMSDVPKHLKPTWDKWGKEIQGAANLSGVDPALLLSHMFNESSGDPSAVSSTGALGLMQVMPGTAAEMGFDSSTFKDNPRDGIMAGAMYLRKQLDAFGGNVKHAVAAYHDGPGNVRKWLKAEGRLLSGPMGVAYRNKVLKDYGSLRTAPNDYEAFQFPNTSGNLHSTGGSPAIPEGRTGMTVLRTPSEQRAFSRAGSRSSQLREEYVGGKSVPLGWYAKMEHKNWEENGSLAEVSEEDFVNRLGEEALKQDKNSRFEDVKNAFISGAGKSATMTAVYGGLLANKVDEWVGGGGDAGDGVLNWGIGSTSYLDRHFQVHDPNLLTTVASGLGSSLPMMAFSGGAGWMIGRGLVASTLGKAGARAIASAALTGQGVNRGLAIGAAVGMNAGMTLTESAMEAGGVYMESMNAEGDEDKAWAAANKALLGNAGVLALSNMVYIPGGRMWAKIAGGMLSEGYQENIQSNISEAALGERDWSGMMGFNHKEEFLVGAIVGGMFSGAIETADSAKNKKALKDHQDGLISNEAQGETEAALSMSAQVTANGMTEEELVDEQKKIKERLDHLQSGETIGSKEDLEGEVKRLEVAYAALHNELTGRDAAAWINEVDGRAGDVQAAVDGAIERSGKLGKVTPKDYDLIVGGLLALGRSGNLTEDTVKAAVEQLPGLSGALDGIRKIQEISAENEDAGGASEEGGQAAASGEVVEEPVATTEEPVAVPEDQKELWTSASVSLGVEPLQGGVPEKVDAATKKVIDRAEKLGATVVWGQSTKSSTAPANGFYDPVTKTIGINASKLDKDGRLTDEFIEFVAQHELGHHLYSNNETRGVVRDLLRKVKTDEKLEKKVKQKLGDYKSVQVGDEIIADMLAIEMMSPGGEAVLLQHIGAGELKKMFRAVQTVIKDIGEDGDAAGASIAKVLDKRLLELEAKIGAEVAKQTGETGTDGGVKASKNTKSDVDRIISAAKAGAKAKPVGSDIAKARKLANKKRAERASRKKAKKKPSQRDLGAIKREAAKAIKRGENKDKRQREKMDKVGSGIKKKREPAKFGSIKGKSKTQAEKIVDLGLKKIEREQAEEPLHAKQFRAKEFPGRSEFTVTGADAEAVRPSAAPLSPLARQAKESVRKQEIKKRLAVNKKLKEQIRKLVRPLGGLTKFTDSNAESALREMLATRERVLEALETISAQGHLDTAKTIARVARGKNGRHNIEVNRVGFGEYEVSYEDAKTGKWTTFPEKISNREGAEEVASALKYKKIDEQQQNRDNIRKAKEEIEAISSLLGVYSDQSTPSDIVEAGSGSGKTPSATDIKNAARQAGEEGATGQEIAEITEKAGDIDLQAENLAETERREREAIDGISRIDALRMINKINTDNNAGIDPSIIQDSKIVRRLDRAGSTSGPIYSFTDVYDIVRASAGKDAASDFAKEADWSAARKRAESRVAEAGATASEKTEEAESAIDAASYIAGDPDWGTRLREGGEAGVNDPNSDGSQPSEMQKVLRQKALESVDAALDADAWLARAKADADAISRASLDPAAYVKALHDKLLGAFSRYEVAASKSSSAGLRIMEEIKAIQGEIRAISTISSDMYQFSAGSLANVIKNGYKGGRARSGNNLVISQSQAVQSMYERHDTSRNAKPDPNKSPQRVVNNAYTWVFDKLHTLKTAQEKYTGGSESQQALRDRGISHYFNMRGIVVGWARVAELFFEKGVVSFFTGQHLSKMGLRQILKEYGMIANPAKYERFGKFMTAKRIVQLAGLDPNNLGATDPSKFSGTPEEVAAFQNEWKEVYDELVKEQDLVDAARMMEGFSNGMLEFLKEMGNISQFEFDKMTDNPVYYAPLYAADSESRGGAGGVDVNRNVDKGVSHLGTLKPGVKIMHPVEAIANNVIRYTHSGYMNYAKNQLGLLVHSVGNSEFGTHLDIDPATTILRGRVESGEYVHADARPRIQRNIKAAVGQAVVYYGIPENKADMIVDVLLNPARGAQSLDPHVELAKTWISGHELGENMIAYLDQGQLRIMEVHPDMMEGFATMRGKSLDDVVRLAGKVSNLLKRGATSTPRFWILNTMRDFMSSVVGSSEMISNPNDFGKFMYNWVRAVGSIMKQDKFYQDFLLHGGGLSEFLSTDPSELRKRVNKLTRSRNPKDIVLSRGQAKYALAMAIDAIGVVSRGSETVTRLAVYRTHLQALENQHPGRAHYLTSQMAAMASRDATVDFARTGSKVKALNQLQPFFTASLGGTDKVMRSLFSKQGDKRGTLMRGFVTLTLPSILLHLANSGEDWYEEKADWEKNLFWMYKVGDTIFRIPKPFDFGLIFASLPERMYDYWLKNDERGAVEWKNLMLTQAYGGSLEISGWMDSWLPPISAWANAKRNYDPFREGKIVKGVREKVIAPYQYSDSTKDISVWMAGFLYNKTGFNKVSPAKIDFWVRSSFGEVGSLSQDALSQIPGVKRSNLERTPGYNRNIFTKAIVSSTPASFGSWSDELFDMYNESMAASSTLNYLKNHGMSDEYKAEYSKIGGLSELYPYFSSIVDNAAAFTNGIEQVSWSDQYTDEQKIEKINELKRARTEIYKQGVYMGRDALPKANRAASKLKGKGK